MEKEGLRYLVILGFILIIFSVFSFNNVFASFDLASNNSYEIISSYAPSQVITGWINISLTDEPADSLLTAFDSNISLLDFLSENNLNCESNVGCSCFPSDCEKGYSSSGTGEESKSFSITTVNEKTIGIKLEDTITGIGSLEFNVSTNAGEACFNPLKIDILDDGEFEWISEQITADYTCFIQTPYGCYIAEDSNDDFLLVEGDSYCNTMNVPAKKGFRLGADVIKNSGVGDVYFTMSIDTYSCPVSVSDGGEIGCNIEFEEEESDFFEAEVCLNVDDLNSNEYSIKYENVDPCGNLNGGGYDFPIFVKPRRYAGITSVEFSLDSDETGFIGSYISSKYNGNCDPECIIPISFSGTNQDITISNLKLLYEIPGTKQEKDIYDVNENQVLIDMDYEKLDLGKANLLVPNIDGKKDLILKLGDGTILEEEISVGGTIIITDITPREVPALIPWPFFVILDGITTNDTLFTWNFGDNSSKQITNKSSNTHIYSNIGTYNLNVFVDSKLGNSTKSVQVTVGSPKDYINGTINDYEDKINKIESEINKLPEWIKNQILKEFDVDDLEAQINAQKKKYLDAFSNDDYVDVMKKLVELKVPNSFNISQKITPSTIIPDSSQINLPALDYLGAGSIDGSEEDYVNAVNNWLSSELTIRVESKTYALYYDDGSVPLYSHVKTTLTPKESVDLGDVYFVINGNPDEIKSDTALRTRDYDDALGMVINDLESAETIEFLYPGKIQIGSIPIYVSPEFRNLEFSAEPGVCNFNKKCEKSLGENYKNCRSDCKPIGWTIFWIMVILFIAFIVYIILQEWYKRHYESNLFKDKNQLFNLINFMSISYNQGLRKSDIFDKLKDQGWEKEQLNYAWNKFQGKRTGMWEIPIFKWVEKKQVKEELAKRKAISKPPQFQQPIRRF